MIGGAARADDLERQINDRAGVNTAGAGVGASGPFSSSEEDGFQYRGITNSNNLDSVFRLPGNSTGQNSGATSGNVSTKGGLTNSTRFSSNGGLSTMHEDYYDSSPFDQGNNTGYGSTGATRAAGAGAGTAGAAYGHSRGDSEDSVDAGFNPSDYDIDEDDEFLPVNRGVIFGTENHSNNSKSRFTEEIIWLYFSWR